MAGSPSGCGGHEEGGQLTEKIRRKPCSVIRFDEIGKAHPDVSRILLQVPEDGHMTDRQGRKVDFENTLLIMTSSVGPKSSKRTLALVLSPIPLRAKALKYLKWRSLMKQKTCKSEFINRLTDVIVFKQLDFDVLQKIVDIEVNEVSKCATEKGISLLFSNSANEFLVQKGYGKKFREHVH
jgi:ATP-dependent Clp protease ATP-binding subunit ClpC